MTVFENELLNKIINRIYHKCSYVITSYVLEAESREYRACSFQLNGRTILCRTAKTTPKKVGQFVTFWKRNDQGTIEPFTESDNIDFFVINVQKDNRLGQFVIPKSTLVAKRIISTRTKKGKRAFRVYPIWDNTYNAQAKRTQKWQLKYFYEVNSETDLDLVHSLYSKSS